MTSFIPIVQRQFAICRPVFGMAMRYAASGANNGGGDWGDGGVVVGDRSSMRRGKEVRSNFENGAKKERRKGGKEERRIDRILSGVMDVYRQRNISGIPLLTPATTNRRFSSLYPASIKNALPLSPFPHHPSLPPPFWCGRRTPRFTPTPGTNGETFHPR